MDDKKQTEECDYRIVYTSIVKFGNKGQIISGSATVPQLALTNKERKNKTFKVVWAEMPPSQ